MCFLLPVSLSSLLPTSSSFPPSPSFLLSSCRRALSCFAQLYYLLLTFVPNLRNHHHLPPLVSPLSLSPHLLPPQPSLFLLFILSSLRSSFRPFLSDGLYVFPPLFPALLSSFLPLFLPLSCSLPPSLPAWVEVLIWAGDCEEKVTCMRRKKRRRQG